MNYKMFEMDFTNKSKMQCKMQQTALVDYRCGKKSTTPSRSPRYYNNRQINTAFCPLKTKFQAKYRL